jgi:hypothetical protein
MLLANGQADTVDSQNTAWHQLPKPPAGSAVLAAGQAGNTDALAVHGSRLTGWRLARGAGVWHQVQVLNVAVQYGSSG